MSKTKVIHFDLSQTGPEGPSVTSNSQTPMSSTTVTLTPFLQLTPVVICSSMDQLNTLVKLKIDGNFIIVLLSNGLERQ